MSAEIITQIVTLAAAVLGIVWHQQRTTDKLRDDMNKANTELRNDMNTLRDDMNQANTELREDMNTLRNDMNTLRNDMNTLREELRTELREEINALRNDMNQGFQAIHIQLTEHGQRLSRIEGFLGIGIPAEVAERAAGAHFSAPAAEPVA
ncbi:MAG: hypothetical protein OXE93_00665 [bacterium]|nr:hypothetical protein [bacterium]